MSNGSNKAIVRIGVYLGLLFLIGLAVHLLYIAHIRPTADMMIDAARIAGQAAPRNFYVIVRDGEQEVCLILFFWSALLTAWKVWEISSEWDYFEILETATLGDLRREANQVNHPLLKALTDSLSRFSDRGDMHEAIKTVKSHLESLSVSMEADNSLFRYVIWVVPSIGFIGTVRGIGAALGEADKALAGDIASMTANLGVAFNSTFVALVASIFLMLFMHILEGFQDKLVLDIEALCEQRLREEERKQPRMAQEATPA